MQLFRGKTAGTFKRFLLFGIRSDRPVILLIGRIIARLIACTLVSLVAWIVMPVTHRGKKVTVVVIRSHASKVSMLIEDLESWRRHFLASGLHAGSEATDLRFVYLAKHHNNALGETLRASYAFYDRSRILLAIYWRYALVPALVGRVYGACKAPNRTTSWQQATSGLRLPVSRADIRESLERCGLQVQEQSFVCFAVAERAYYEREVSIGHRQTYSTRFDYIPQLSTYTRGLITGLPVDTQIVRMAAWTRERIPLDESERIFDYANRCRSEVLDLWLSANCQFFVAGACGAYWIASALDRPVLQCDQYTGKNYTYGVADMFLPLLAEDVRTGELMPFSWYAKNGDWGQGNLAERGLRPHHNTDLDIGEAVAEMHGRLNGSWSDGPGDAERQQSFHAIARARETNYAYNPRIRVGSAFLRRFEHLLR